MNDPRSPSPPFKNTDGLSGAKKKTRRLFSPNPKLLDPVVSKREREREKEPGWWVGRLKREVDIIRGLIHHKSNAALTSPDSTPIIAVPQLFTPFFVLALLAETSALGS